MRPCREDGDGSLRSGHGDARNRAVDEYVGWARVGVDGNRGRGQRTDIDFAAAAAGVKNNGVAGAQRTDVLVIIGIILVAVVPAADNVNGHERVTAATQLVAYQKRSVDLEIG